MDVGQLIGLGVIAAFAAIFGSMLGLGGGVFLVPIYTLFMGVDQKVAIGASAVVIVTNSIVGSSVHLRSRFTNLQLGMLLQVTMATGAIAGALFGVSANPGIVFGVFGVVLVYAAVSMVAKREAPPKPLADDTPDPYGLGAGFYDPAIKSEVGYVPGRIPVGLGISAGAGVLSGMLGVGGGVIMVPVMNLLMRVPVKAAVGTSAFMVGITSVATAFVFYSQDKIDPTVVVPAVIGVFVGGQVGARLTRRFKARRLAWIFAIILGYLGISLILRAFDITLPGQS